MNDPRYSKQYQKNKGKARMIWVPGLWNEKRTSQGSQKKPSFARALAVISEVALQTTGHLQR